jgi:hypothetical protein
VRRGFADACVLRRGGRRKPKPQNALFRLEEVTDGAITAAAWSTSMAFSDLDSKDATYTEMEAAGIAAAAPPTTVIPWDAGDEEDDDKALPMETLPPRLHVRAATDEFKGGEPPMVLKPALGCAGREVNYVYTREQALAIVREHAEKARAADGFLEGLRCEHQGRVPGWVLQAYVPSYLALRGRHKCHLRTYLVLAELPVTALDQPLPRTREAAEGAAGGGGGGGEGGEGEGAAGGGGASAVKGGQEAEGAELELEAEPQRPSCRCFMYTGHEVQCLHDTATRAAPDDLVPCFGPVIWMVRRGRSPLALRPCPLPFGQLTVHDASSFVYLLLNAGCWLLAQVRVVFWTDSDDGTYQFTEGEAQMYNGGRDREATQRHVLSQFEELAHVQVRGAGETETDD